MKSSSDPGCRPVTVREQPIELCQFLKFSGAAATGGEAKIVITEGLVTLNGEVETRKRRKLVDGDQVVFGENRLVVRVG
jgi:ribosome-associated protein